MKIDQLNSNQEKMDNFIEKFVNYYSRRYESYLSEENKEETKRNYEWQIIKMDSGYYFGLRHKHSETNIHEKEPILVKHIERDLCIYEIAFIQEKVHLSVYKDRIEVMDLGEEFEKFLIKKCNNLKLPSILEKEKEKERIYKKHKLRAFFL